MPDIAIRVSNRSKCYQIYDALQDRLNQPARYLLLSIYQNMSDIAKRVQRK